MQHRQGVGEFRALAQDQLGLDHAALHLRQGALQQQLPGVQDAHVVAHVLQLPQIVGREQDRGAPLGHVLHQDAPDLPAHHRVQAVHRLVQDQHPGLDGDGQQEGRLLLHALGVAPQLHPVVQAEGRQQPAVALVREVGIDAAVKPAHLLEARGGEVEDVVRDERDPGFDVGILIDRLAVHRDRPVIRAENAGDVPDQGGLSRPVGPDQAVDRPVRHGQGQIVQGPDLPEGLGQIAYFDHLASASFIREISASSLSPSWRSSVAARMSFRRSSRLRPSSTPPRLPAKEPRPVTE